MLFTVIHKYSLGLKHQKNLAQAALKRGSTFYMGSTDVNHQHTTLSILIQKLSGESMNDSALFHLVPIVIRLYLYKLQQYGIEIVGAMITTTNQVPRISKSRFRIA